MRPRLCGGTPPISGSSRVTETREGLGQPGPFRIASPPGTRPRRREASRRRSSWCVPSWRSRAKGGRIRAADEPPAVRAMANDGKSWVKNSDVDAADTAMLEKLWHKVKELADSSPHVERFNSGGAKHWYPTILNDPELERLVDQLDCAQAELEAACKSVAITSGIADSDRTEGWRRVASWLDAKAKQCPPSSATG